MNEFSKLGEPFEIFRLLIVNRYWCIPPLRNTCLSPRASYVFAHSFFLPVFFSKESLVPMDVSRNNRSGHDMEACAR